MARKESNIHYIYKTTCNVTGRYYVGMHSTSNLEDGYMGSGTRLRHSIRKHGKENHIKEILCFFDNKEELVIAETKAITLEMITDNDCMNLKAGGTGGWDKTHTKAFKEKLVNDIDFFNKFAMRRSEVTKKTMLEGKLKPINEIYDWKGRTHSEETKKLMSESSKGTGVGESNSQYGTCWVTKEGVNKKIKKESLETYIINNWVKGRKC